ncbi:polysulfide reductase [Denitrobacterium detoxificans]|uniref:Formate-dependent nitrite reductase, membrane component NrfD n=1 Tax=Denitrobacterium detoxificans TaxID=79604 RepID=A0A172RZJ3_9ACTN|nr:NrfD/PsrC family molybdoenzyme membrane anchor subunit [Denitrobacterium detoxificans]ANE23139.1 polysulfide reductase [Denitrobacterium detoxificans]SEO54459.1 Formate-dependent nitrite reductase, membrane component NrfD [Denitrobacterium detoxificans]
MQFEPVWGIPIALYLFLAGLGGGAFITSAFVAWKHPHAVTTRRIGHFIAPVVVAIGLVLLMVDAKGGLLNPWRFALLIHNVGSVMTWGVYFLAVFEVIALVVAFLEIRKIDIPRWLDLVGVVFAVCVGAYTGCLLGVVKTYPLWNNAILPVLFLVSAVSTGAAAVVLGSLIKAPQEAESLPALKRAHYWLPIVELVLVVAMLFIVNSSGDTAHATVSNLVAGSFAPAFWIAFVLAGLVLPAIIETFELFVNTGAPSRTLGMGSEAGVLIGGFALRALIVLAALPATIVVSFA